MGESTSSGSALRSTTTDDPTVANHASVTEDDGTDASTPSLPPPSKSLPPWTVDDAKDLYLIERWGSGYFDVSPNGNMLVLPNGTRGKSAESIPICDVVEAAKAEGLSTPLLIRFQDILDGLSNTLQLTESAGRPNQYRNGKLVLTANGNNRVNGGGWARPASELNLLKGASADGLTIPGPNAINVTNGEALGTYTAPNGHPVYGVDGTGQIYGFHTGGVNALIGDGSVRFLRQTIDIRALAALVTRNGGEVNIE